MNPDSPVTLRRLNYRGAVSFQLAWEEDGAPREADFESEAEAVVQMAAIEDRLRTAAMAGKGYTVNPFGASAPFITSKDVHFAAMRLQPRGLDFRDAVTHHVAATTALQGTGASVTDAAREYAEAVKTLKPFDVSLNQVLFEWVELKKHVGDRPLFEVLRRFLRDAPPAAPAPVVPSPPVAAAVPAVASAPAPVAAPVAVQAPIPASPPVVNLSAPDLTMAPFPAMWPPSPTKRGAG